jgi:hypothetical protein
MNASFKIPAIGISAGVLLTAGAIAVSEPADKEARVTRIIRDVKILPSESDARPAVIDDKVQEGTAVRTGDESRSELTFVDLTITRLGANTVYSFDKAGRNIRLQSGTILVRVPKDSGGAEITTSAVTVAITGTTGIFASTPEGQSSLIVLEGDARMSLNKYPRESARVRAGKRIDVEGNAKKIPPPTDVDLEELMKTSPLITDFPPLPSQDLILEAIRKQNPRSHVTSLPSGGGPTQPGPVVYPSQPVITGGPPSLPSSCWCCINGQVVQTTEAECRARGTQCYGSREEALRNCKEKTNQKTCWCCMNGEVVQTSEADCREREGQCYGSRKEAMRYCRGEQRPTPTPTTHRHHGPKDGEPGQNTNPHEPYPTPTPHRPHRPKDTNPKEPGYGGSGQATKPRWPAGTQTTTKPGTKRPTKGPPKATPTPPKIY